MMASTAARDEDGYITEGARKSIHDIARLSRLFHQLFWSVNVIKLNALASKEGLSYLLSLRQINPKEYESLKKVIEDGHGVDTAALTWMTARCWMALSQSHIHADKTDISEKVTDLRRLM